MSWGESACSQMNKCHFPALVVITPMITDRDGSSGCGVRSPTEKSSFFILIVESR